MRIISQFSGNNSFLSNFYPVEIEYKGILYPSVEHAYQAAKTKDRDKRNEIALLATAGMAKRAGRNLKIRPGWNAMRVKIMRELLYIKFQNPELAEKLRGTGNYRLVEGNFWGDTFWGVCNGVGQNRLGKLLMEIRQEIKSV